MGCLSYMLAGIVLGILALNGTQSGTPNLSDSTNPPPSSLSVSQCLPTAVKLIDVVSVDIGGAHQITVEDKLNALGAHCSSDNKLRDRSGKEIYFYPLTGCWGNPPINAAEILQQQTDEIAKLKEQYTVIEMTCNPQGLSIS
jgi:hypothetical protein